MKRRGRGTAGSAPALRPPDRHVFTVEELNQAIQTALREAFPGPVWVRGEVQRLPADAARRQHVYFELHQPAAGGAAAGFQVPVAIMSWDRQRFDLGRFLDGSDPDLRLTDKLEVCLECVVDYYPPYGKLSLKVVGVDRDFTLGRLEAQRRAVLDFLRREDLLKRQASLALPDLPLRVGLITSAGSAAEQDFLSGLRAAAIGFRVWRADCRMAGESSEPQIIAALRGLAGLRMDVIVITRGGGSRADLSWFDQQNLCAAIARCPVPVITAIGHEIDLALADLVAHAHCKTPTAAAQLLVDRVATAAARCEAAAGRTAELARAALAVARDRMRFSAHRLERRVARDVAAAREHLAGLQTGLTAASLARLARERTQHEQTRRRLALGAARSLAAAHARDLVVTRALRGDRLLAAWPRHRQALDRVAARVARLAAAALARAGRRLESLQGGARLLDPERLLARGYTMTMDAAGRPLKSAAGLRRGDALVTRFWDGQVASVVERVQRGGPETAAKEAV